MATNKAFMRELDAQISKDTHIKSKKSKQAKKEAHHNPLRTRGKQLLGAQSAKDDNRTGYDDYLARRKSVLRVTAEQLVQHGDAQKVGPGKETTSGGNGKNRRVAIVQANGVMVDLTYRNGVKIDSMTHVSYPKYFENEKKESKSARPLLPAASLNPDRTELRAYRASKRAEKRATARNTPEKLEVAAQSELTRAHYQKKKDARKKAIPLESLCLATTWDFNNLTDHQWSLLCASPIRFESVSEDFQSVFMTYLDVFSFVTEYGAIVADVGILMFLMYQANSVVFMGVAVTNFLKSSYSNEKSREIWNSLKDVNFNVFYEFISQRAAVTAEALSDTLTDISLFFGSFVSGEFVKAITNVILSVASLQWFSKDVASRIYDICGTPPKMTMMKMVEYILNQLAVLAKAGEDLIRGVSLSKILLGDDPFPTCLRRMRVLIEMKDLLYVGLPVEGKMDMKMFLSESSELLATSKTLIDKLHLLDPKRAEMEKVQCLLRIINEEVRAISNSDKRLNPFGLVIGGPPGIGKAAMIDLFAEGWCMAKGLKFTPSVIYHRGGPSNKFWEGHEPDSQEIVHCSEVGNTADNILKAKGDERIQEICSIMDSQPHHLDMAFEKKGKAYARMGMFMVDTNIIDFSAKFTVKNVAALYRRFYYIIPHVKPEYRHDTGTSINSTKSLDSNSPIMDRWYFEVYHYVATGNNDATRINDILLADNVNIYGVTKFMYGVFRDYIANQCNVLDRMKIEGTFAHYFDPQEPDRHIESMEEKAFKYEEKDLWEDFPMPSPISTESAFIPLPIMWVFTWLWGIAEILSFCLWAIVSLLMSRGSFNIMQFMLGLVVCYVASFCRWMYRRPGVAAILLSYLIKTVVEMVIYIGLWMFAKKYKPEIQKSFHNLLFILRKKSEKYSSMVPWWHKHKRQIGAGIALFSGLCVGANYIHNAAKKKKEAPELQSTTLHLPSEHNKPLNELEEKLDLGNSYTRFKVHDNMWNDQITTGEPALHKGTPEELSSALQRNVRHVRVTGENSQVLYLLGLCENMALINTHSLGSLDKVILEVAITGNVNKSDVTRNSVIGPRQRFDLGNDLTVVALSGIIFTDIRKHISDRVLEEYAYEGYFYKRPVMAHHTKEEVLFVDSVTQKYFSLSNVWKYPFPEHAPGWCGTPLVVKRDSGSCLVGLHTGGQEGRGFAVTILRSEMNRAIDALHQSDPMLPLASAVPMQALGPPCVKSPFRYLPLRGISYFGRTEEKVCMNQKSNLVRTRFAYRAECSLRTVGLKMTKEFAPPLMQPTVCNGEYISPYNLFLKSVNTQKPCLDPDVLAKVVEELTTKFVTELKARNVEIRPLIIGSAINGELCDPFLRRINTSTAGGEGFPGPKSKHLVLLDLADAYIREPTSQVKGMLVEAIERYIDGEVVAPRYRLQLKDEARSLINVISGKTRPFCVVQLVHLIISRVFLSMFYSMMTEHSDIFYTGIGINMYTQAGEFIERMRAFSRLFFEGDYGTFDQRTPFEIGRAAATLAYNIMKAFGYNEEILKIVSGILTDNLFPIIIMCGDVFELAGYKPSGMLGTAEDNSNRNLIMLMYCWYYMTTTRDKPFFKYVLPATFGDDVLAAVKEAVAKLFNNNIYKDFCAKHYHLPFTNSEKTEQMRDFVDIDTCSFLKRKFVYRQDLQQWVAPLDENSLFKTLMWTIPSKSIPESEQMKGAVTSVLWECALRFQEPAYQRIAAALSSILSESYFMGERVPLPTYRDIIDRIFPPVCTAQRAIGLESKCADERNKNTFISNLPLINMDTNADIRSTYYHENKSISLMEAEMKEAIFHLENTYRNMKTISTPAIRQLLQRVTQPNPGDLEEVLRLRTLVDSIEVSITRLQDVAALRAVRMESDVSSSVQKEGSITTLKVDENLGDVAGSDVAMASSGQSQNASQGQYEILDMADFLARPVEIYSGSMAYATDYDYILNVWSLFTQIPAVRAKLRNYAYLRGNLHLRVAFSGTPFNYGRILLSYQPYAKYNQNLIAYAAALAIDSNLRGNFHTYLSQAVGSNLVDVAKNEPVEIICPFISSKPMYRLYNSTSTVIGTSTDYTDLADAGNLYLSTLNQIQTVSTGASQVYFQIYAWMDELSFGTGTGTQVAITTESALDERNIGPVERIATRAWEVSSALQGVGFLAPFATASTMALSALKGVAALFGWSRPVLLSPAVRVKNEPFQNGALTIGCETSQRVVLDPLQELTVDPRVCGTQKDEMLISYLASVVSYYTTFTWNNSDATVSTPIFLTGVSPSLVNYYSNGTTVWSQPTALAFAVQPFTWWRGQVKVRFEIVCSQFHRGKLGFGYEPNCAQNVLINAAITLNKQFLKVIDIQETQIIDLVVPWAAMRPWLKTWPAVSAYASESPSFLQSTGAGYANGYIFVFPFTKLQSPDDSSVSINVYVSCDDMQVNGMTTIGLPTSRAVYTESCLQPADVSTMNLNESTATKQGLCEDYFGEQPVSYRSLLKRYVGRIVATPASSTAGIHYMQYTQQILPPNMLPYGGTSTALPLDLFSYLRYAYLGIKGGIRMRVRYVNSSGISGAGQWVKFTLSSPSSSFSNSTSEVTTGNNVGRLEGSATFMPQVNGGVEAEFPYYSSNLFQLCFSDSYDDLSTYPDNMEKTWFRNCIYAIDSVVVGTVVTIATEHASGEDFNLLRFQGAPYYSGGVVA